MLCLIAGQEESGIIIQSDKHYIGYRECNLLGIVELCHNGHAY